MPKSGAHTRFVCVQLGLQHDVVATVTGTFELRDHFLPWDSALKE